MTFSLTYELEEIGWSTCTIETADGKLKLGASYLSDPLGDLLVAAATVLSGFQTSIFSFDDEPVEYRWIITRNSVRVPGPLTIQVVVLEFDDLRDEKPNAEGRVLLNTKCTPLVFAKTVYYAAREVLEEHGEHGYHEKWRSKFPQSKLALLKDMIFDCDNSY